MHARHTTTVTAVLAAAAMTLAGCSSSDSGGDDKPKPAVTVTKTPELSQAEQREACVDAWADAIQAGEDDVNQEPKACKGLPEDDKLDRYMEGLQERNARNRG